MNLFEAIIVFSLIAFFFLVLAVWLIRFDEKEKSNQPQKPSLQSKGVTVEWARFGDKNLTVEVVAPFASPFILDSAKQLVDEICPQRYGPHGAQYYSNKTRERLLNIVLWFFDARKRFPVGDLGLDTHWLWKRNDALPNGWLIWNGTDKGTKPSFWIVFPPLPDEVVERCQKEFNER